MCDCCTYVDLHTRVFESSLSATRTLDIQWDSHCKQSTDPPFQHSANSSNFIQYFSSNWISTQLGIHYTLVLTPTSKGWTTTYYQVRIQDLVKGAQGSEAESCRRSKVELHERSEHFVAGVQGLLKGPGNFWVFNAQVFLLAALKLWPR